MRSGRLKKRGAWVIRELDGTHSPRGSRNSHINLKKRRTYAVRFYEDKTVKTNSKSTYLILPINT